MLPPGLLSLAAARAALAAESAQPFTVLLRHGTMSVELFAPRGTDTQQPHAQDELYVVVSGTATLYRAGERLPCGPSDVLFVPAGVEHRFEDFSADFATWVIFYGPMGGEQPTATLAELPPNSQ